MPQATRNVSTSYVGIEKAQRCYLDRTTECARCGDRRKSDRLGTTTSKLGVLRCAVLVVVILPDNFSKCEYVFVILNWTWGERGIGFYKRVHSNSRDAYAFLIDPSRQERREDSMRQRCFRALSKQVSLHISCFREEHYLGSLNCFDLDWISSVQPCVSQTSSPKVYEFAR